MNTEAIERIKGFCCEVDEAQWKELVRVADDLDIEIGQVNAYKFAQLDGCDFSGYTLACFRDTWGEELIPYPDFLAKMKGEERWEPKAGETVEVSHEGAKWWEREFIGESRGKYIGWTSDGEPHAWAMCRKARPTITRTEAESLLNKRIID
jgi:hypothetical protein